MTDSLPLEGTTSINGVDLYYRDWGGQGRPLVLLHGLASHSGIWDLVAPLLSHHARVLAPDLRGHGASSKPDHGYDFDTVAEDVRNFWESLGLTFPVLVGHSWGGNVALQGGVTHVHQVAGLVMVDGGFIEPSAIGDWTWEQARKEMAPPIFEGVTPQELLTKMRQGTLGPYWNPDVERIVLSNFHVTDGGFVEPKLSRENHMKIVRSLWEHKPSTLYPLLQRPALVLATRGRPQKNPLGPVKADLVSRAQALLPQGRVLWMEDTIHDVPLQRPRELADLILGFVRGLPGTT